MRRFIPLLAFVLAAASCGGEPPAGMTSQALTVKHEVVGSCCDSGGVYVGPGPIYRFKHTMRLPPLPIYNAESVFSTFHTDAKAASTHADGGFQSVDFFVYRPVSTYVNGVLVGSHTYTFGVEWTSNDGHGNLTGGYLKLYQFVHPGDNVFAEYDKNFGTIRTKSDNASGLGTAFDETTPIPFTPGQPDLDTLWPLQVDIGVYNSCQLDMPGATIPNTYGPGSFPTFTGYAVGAGAPMTVVGPFGALTSGCSLRQDFDWNNFTNTISYQNAGTP